MADTRVADLTDSGVPDVADLLYLVDVSAGPPRDRKLTVGNLATAVEGEIDFVTPPVFPTGTRVFDAYLLAETTDATPEVMTPDIPITDDSTLLFVAYIVTKAASGATGSYKLEGSIRRNGGITSPDSAIFRTTFTETDASWAVSFSADGGSNSLKIVVQGAVGITLKWFAHVHCIEVTFA